MNLIETLNWRYATKRMLDKKIPQEQISEILEAIRLAPSAYGLQPFNVIVTENKELIQKIHDESCPQIVVLQCSHLLIFKTMKTFSEDYVELFLAQMKEARKVDDEYIDGYRNKIRKVMEKPDVNKFEWAALQTYIALGYATIAAANLKIDATPIEGFSPKALDKLLDLNTKEEGTTVMLALGYRDEEEDHLCGKPKVRKSMENMVEIL